MVVQCSSRMGRLRHSKAWVMEECLPLPNTTHIQAQILWLVLGHLRVHRRLRHLAQMKWDLWQPIRLCLHAVITQWVPQVLHERHLCLQPHMLLIHSSNQSPLWAMSRHSSNYSTCTVCRRQPRRRNGYLSSRRGCVFFNSSSSSSLHFPHLLHQLLQWQEWEVLWEAQWVPWVPHLRWVRTRRSILRELAPVCLLRLLRTLSRGSKCLKLLLHSRLSS